ncbi:MAG: hypothetical protein K1X92_08930 [Bacteroidia bacterium]|nr:hypothetical protein [Bacteroidia bacterium]
MVEKFETTSNFLELFEDESRNVNNDVINLTDIGADPAVLINNTTFPIATAVSTDANIPVQLDRYDTENTEIPDADIETLSYDVIESHNRRHVRALNETSLKKAAHAIAPADGTVATLPMVKTTGADDGDGFKKITVADILRLKQKFDDAEIPMERRGLLLTAKHVNQLALEDTVFRDELRRSGTAMFNYFGFKVYQFSGNPIYTALFEKVAYGAVAPVGARYASVAFCGERTFKAKGTPKMYKSVAENNPPMRKTTIGYSLRYVAMRLKNEGIGVIVADSI